MVGVPMLKAERISCSDPKLSDAQTRNFEAIKHNWAGACEAGHVTRSMSRKARSPDNARAEGFFGTLKCDFFDGRDWSGVTFEQFSAALDEYIEWYRGGKLKKSLGWRTIRQSREELGYAA